MSGEAKRSGCWVLSHFKQTIYVEVFGKQNNPTQANVGRKEI